MMQKNNVLRKNDFEKYEVLLPYSAALGKRRRQFLCSELEKMHPCFSDEFCFDSTVRKIGKKGLSADVLVMSKRKLAEYEGKRNFSGTGFFAEKSKHRFFINEKLRFTGLCMFVCLLLGIVGCLHGMILGSFEGKGEVTKISMEEGETSDLSTVAAPENTAPADIPLFNPFFEVLDKSDGKISSLEWKMDGFTESLSVSLLGIFPEDLSLLNDFRSRNKSEEVVTYEKGLPAMQVFYSQKHLSLNAEKNALSVDAQDQAPASNADFNKALRKIISENGAALTGEKAPPYHLEFICDFDSGTKRLFQQISEIINLEKRRITELNIICRGDGKLGVGLSIERNQQENLPAFDLCRLSENLKVFNVSKVSEKKKIPTHNSTPAPAKVLKKIGEIKTPDNATVVFYKNDNGKIERVIQRN